MEGDIKAIRQLAEELKAWRSESSPTRPLPAHIWTEAAKVAQRAGVGPVARALRLDHSKLKGLTLKERDRSTVAAPAFVELQLPLASHSLGDCTVEIESTQGARMRIQIQNATSSGLAGLIREFVA